jgi:Domain of unknown function (DUF4037)
VAELSASEASTPEFIPGLELSRLFFAEAVRPLLDEAFPGLRYAAGLLGSGSDVLGFDTEMSRDHDWGPRVDLFLEEDGFDEARAAVDAALRERLPRSFRGYATSFSEPDPADHGTRLPAPAESGPVNHKVGIHTPRTFFRAYLVFDPAGDITPADWLTFPEQKLRTIAQGAVFHDGIGLEALRGRFAYYPHDVWLYLLAAGWGRIGQEEHLMGRAGLVGDEIGSALIGARLVRDVMRLCFLMERTYAPYPKWLGTAFARLACAAELSPHLRGALAAGTWREREAHLVPAYEAVARMHNGLGITEPLPETARAFCGRPFRVMALHGFASAILARITDERLRALARRPLIGGIDQWSDSTDLVSYAEWRPLLRRLYE